ncbi:MAG: thioesterase [Alphaproteobacteria bacterium]|nr:thioesterase [Alphaproteobacteria bacterium]
MFSASIDAPLLALETRVRDAWIDYNGHMNVAYYTLAFDLGVDRFYDLAGFGEDYKQRTGCSTFALEQHVTFQRELLQDAPIRITVQVLDHDAKRLHYFQRMHHGEQGYLAATCEWVSLHVDTTQRRATPFPPDILAGLARLHATHASLGMPAEHCTRMGLKRPRSP